jgi:hypothetical protein
MEHAVNPDGSKRYLLAIASTFVDTDATNNGASAVNWKNTTAGIACASSFEEAWDGKVTGGAKVATIHCAMPDYVERERDFVSDDMAEVPGPFTTIGEAGDFSAYVKNGQWDLHAIGATTLNAGGAGQPYNAPSYVLQDPNPPGDLIEGAGVKIGFMGRGSPAKWNSGTVSAGGGFRADKDPSTATLHPAFDLSTLAAPGDTPADDGTHAGIVPFDVPGEDPNQPGHPNTALVTDPVQFGSTGPLGVLCSRAVGTPTISDSAIADKAVKGRMRGIAPQATVITYGMALYDSAGNWYSGIRSSDILLAMTLAVTHGCNIFVSTESLLRPQTFIAHQKESREIWRRATKLLSDNDILFLNRPWFISMDISEGSWYFSADQPNAILVGGTGPRAYDPFSPNLNLYTPTPGTAKARANNLDRVCMNRVDIGPLFLAGYGTNFGNSIDCVAPAGSVDGVEAPGPYGQFNSGVYTTSPFPGTVRDVPFTLGMFGSSLGDHGYASGYAETAVTYAAGIAALVYETYKNKTASFPSAVTAKHILLKTADDDVGPEDEDMVFNSIMKKYPMEGTNQNVKGPFPGTPNNGWVNYAGNYKPSRYFVPGTNFLSDLDWQIIHDPGMKSDKPGKDKFFGHGRLNVLAAITEAGAA